MAYNVYMGNGTYIHRETHKIKIKLYKEKIEEMLAIIAAFAYAQRSGG